MDWLAPLFLNFLPVLAFLAVLVYLDSYKLVGLKSVLVTIGSGVAAAGASYVINSLTLDLVTSDMPVPARFAAPLVEETAKAAFVVWLLRTDRVGFLVDAGIRGFAAGAGFALVENLYYLTLRPDAHLLLWVVRGFGTAVMHGGATALVAVVTKTLFDVTQRTAVWLALPGLFAAILIHTIYNLFLLSPAMTTVVIMLTFPPVFALVFLRSEQATRHWLGSGFDLDRDLLEMITSGVLAETSVGKYLHSLQEKFPAQVVADMLCLTRIHAELAIQAKGILMMREAGFLPPPDPEVESRLAELQYLEKSIGPAGKIALRPFIRKGSHDRWQLAILREGG
jgi:RsiW-degrading membrane proteinase PrsW (M82 family)